jgi:hypothetical protein
MSWLLKKYFTNYTFIIYILVGIVLGAPIIFWLTVNMILHFEEFPSKFCVLKLEIQ